MLEIYCCILSIMGGRLGVVVNAACLESRRSRVRTSFWPPSFKEKNASSALTRDDSIFWRAPVTER